MVYRRDDQIFGGGIGFMGQAALPAPKILGLESQGNITLAVSTTGNDTDPTRPARIVQGDWSAKPFATIQAAIDALPLLGRTSGQYRAPDFLTTINVGAGTFPGFSLAGAQYDIKIQGTRNLATLATGPSTGTATSGGLRSLTLTGAGWTVNDLRGRYVNVTAGAGAGQILPVMKNTTDTITFAGNPAPALESSSVFSIEDVASIVNTVPTGRYACAFLGECAAAWVNDLKSVAPGPFAGFAVSNSGRVFFVRCVALGGSIGFSSNFSTSTVWLQCFAANASSAGFGASSTGVAQPYFCGTVDCAIGFSGQYGLFWFGVFDSTVIGGTQGVYIEGAQVSWVYSTLLDGCQTGIEAYETHSIFNGVEINNVTRTFRLDRCWAYLTGGLSGTGNTGFGLNLAGGINTAQLEVGCVTTITGTLGEVTVDGSTDTTWAALALAGSYAVDVATSTRVNRR
jgi:hypothetical protein